MSDFKRFSAQSRANGLCTASVSSEPCSAISRIGLIHISKIGFEYRDSSAESAEFQSSLETSGEPSVISIDINPPAEIYTLALPGALRSPRRSDRDGSR